MLRWLVSILLMLLPSLVLAGKPPAIVPGDPALVLERLPSGYAALEPSASGKPAPPLTHAVQLLTIASRTGDARLAARADAMLSRFPANDDSPAVLRARAFSAQHRHDFAAALQLLDKLIAKDPRDGDARLSRIQLQLVQGRLDRARSDCGSLALGVDSDLGLLCAAAISLRTGNTDAAAAMTDRWLAGAKTDPETRRYVLVMRAEIASRAGSADADQWFQQALALAPGDVRTLAAYARHLRATGRNRAVLTLLTDASNNDGLQLQRALAALAAHDPSAPALIEAQGRRYALAHALGSQPEIRDEAEYMLTLRGDAASALALALRNFENQRDYEDVNLLQRAAKAAGRPDALQPVLAWARSQQLDQPPLPSGGS